MTTNVPQITFSPTGLTVPTEAEILAGVQLDNNAAFGGNLNPALETPQGQMASSLAAIIADKDAQIAYLANQFDPTYAEGRFQDALGKIYFLTRIPSAGTVVQLTCYGLNGTVIPVGAAAQNSATGEIYSCTTPATIVGGSAVAEFTNNTHGPNPCATGALDTIYQAIPGWELCENLSDGAIGRNVESRAAFENRRRASVATNAKGYVQSIRAAILQLPGVLSAYAIDNPTSSPITVGGLAIPAGETYVAVVGGNSDDIGLAMVTKKTMGAPWRAGTNTVYVPDTSYPIPYPTYTATYTIPTNIPIHFAVNISASDLLPTTIDNLIKQAIVNCFSGEDGGEPANIGYKVFASRFYQAVRNTDPACNVVSIKVGTTSTPTADSVNININQFPTINPDNIVVTQV